MEGVVEVFGGCDELRVLVEAFHAVGEAVVLAEFVGAVEGVADGGGGGEVDNGDVCHCGLMGVNVGY